MTKKRKTGIAIGAAAACIAVLRASGACNEITKEEKAVYPAVTTSTVEITTATTLPTTKASVTTTAATTTATQITTTVTCSAAEQGLGKTPPHATMKQTTAADTTVQPTTTAAPITTTAPAPMEPHNGQTSGDYIYCIGFGWVFNEGGGGEGSVNYEMYCNGNKIGYFG